MKWRSVKWFVVLVCGAVLFLAFRKPAEKYFDIAKSLDIFATLFKEVNTYYVDEVEPQRLIRIGINGMLESLDPYTDYIPEDEMEAFRITTTGQYGGVGALIGIIHDKTVITHPYRNFPAYKAGLRVGDEIVAIDGKVLKARSTSDVSVLLKGQPRTDVEVKIKRYGQKEDLTFKIRRDRISVSNIAYSGIVQPAVGYIKLDDFTSGASREMSDAVVKLKEQGAKSLIIDLRDNPGGLLHEAVNIVGHFIPKGREVVSTKGKVDEWNKSYTTLNNPIDTEIPIVVLTSEGSASASEIVAGALQDYDRAVLVGKKTFGKGLVQTTRPLSYNSQLKVTTAKYYTPSGRCIQAMDYTHRRADGTVVRVADSLKSEFKTRNGRKVFDGGGLDPDVDVDEDTYATVTVALINSGLIFEYASRYCGEHPARPDLKTFTLDDKEYDQFTAWVKTQKFTYSTALERDTRTLIENAKREKYYSELEGQLTSLQSKVEANKSTDMVRFKKEISGVLAAQIAFHYDLEEGQALVSLKDDHTLREACRVLSAPTEYSHILSFN
jgi:carboxyl-terminal processing protease